MIDQSFVFSTALAVGCGVGIGWIVRGIFRSRTEPNDLASEVNLRVSDNIGHVRYITIYRRVILQLELYLFFLLQLVDVGCFCTRVLTLTNNKDQSINEVTWRLAGLV